MWWISGVLLLLLASPSAAKVETRMIQWDYEASVMPEGFVLEACLVKKTGCAWKPTQVLQPTQRKAVVAIVEGLERCFQVWAIQGPRKAGPSNTLCLSE